jgi:uncharacterized membrane protein YhaH (DUF805 family)
MSFQESIVTCFQKYLDWHGRASRPEYWWFALFYFIVSIVVSIIDQVTGSIILGVIVWLIFLLPSLMVGIRRLHDTDRSGWWMLIGLIPIVGAIVLIVFWASAGTPGPNDYGPPPGRVNQAGPAY